MNEEKILERVKHALYAPNPETTFLRWRIPGYPIIVGGSVLSREDYEHLVKDFGVRAVINVETEHSDVGLVPSELLCEARYDDNGQPIPVATIRKLIEFAEREKHTGMLYVHCQMGGSRSPGAAYAILRHSFGLSQEEALSAINQGFCHAEGHQWGWHPVHQEYIASAERALKAPPLPTGPIRLNIACGANVFPGWINLDRTDIEAEYLSHLRSSPSFEGWPEHQRKLGLAVKEGLVEFRQKDLREGFPEYADNSVDAIYCGQMIEHLHRFTEAPKFLRECHRMLKPGGWIRLTTPDLGILLKEYESGNTRAFANDQPALYRGLSPADQLCCMLFGASGDGCTRENYEGHFHCYTELGLRGLLADCGFQFDIPTPERPEFSEVIDCGMSHSMAVQARKP